MDKEYTFFNKKFEYDYSYDHHSPYIRSFRISSLEVNYSFYTIIITYKEQIKGDYFGPLCDISFFIYVGENKVYTEDSLSVDDAINAAKIKLIEYAKEFNVLLNSEIVDILND